MKVNDIEDTTPKVVSPKETPAPPVISAENSIADILVTVLPSKFKTYPEGATISYKPYTYGQILKSSQSHLSKKDKLQAVLDGITTSFPKEELTYFDVLYLATLRKLSTFNSAEFRIKYKCPNTECGKANDYNFRIDTIEYDDLEVPDLPLVYDIQGVEIHSMPITIGAYMDLLRDKKDQDRLAAFAATVVNMKSDRAYRVLAKATGTELELLKEVDEMLYFGIKPYECTCSECGTVTDININNDNIFIEPFRGDQEPIRSKIRFGVQ